jgi:hypothetical protein
MTVTPHYLVYALVLSLAALHCGPDLNVAGGTDMPDETRAAIIGSITATSGAPLADANVCLYLSKPVIAEPSDLAGNTRTDAGGRYRFTRVPPGTYRILALSHDSVQTVVSAAVTISTAIDTVTRADTCVGAGSLQGALLLPLRNGITAGALLYNEPFASALDASGTFSLRAVSAGSHLLVIIVRGTGKPVAVAAESVFVAPGAITTAPALIRFAFIADANPALLEDFEDSTQWNANGGFWWDFNDNPNTLHTVSRHEYAAASGSSVSRFCGHLHAELDRAASWSFAGIGTTLGDPAMGVERGYDFSRLSSLDFDVRGTANFVDIELWSPLGDYIVLDTIDAAPATWTHHTIFLDSALTRMPTDMREQWTAQAPYVTDLQWVVRRTIGAPDTADLWIDNVRMTFK